MAAIPLSIFPIADDRMPDAGEMDAYLVLPARQQINFQQSKVFRLLEYFISCPGQSSFCGVGRGVHDVGFVLRQVCRNGLSLFITSTMNDRKILLLRFLPLIL